MKERLEKLYGIMEEGNLAACILAKPENIYYFTGVYPIESSFLITPRKKEPVLLVAPSSYKEAEEAARVDVIKGELNMLSSLKGTLLSLSCLPVKNDIFFRNVMGSWRSKPLGIEGEYLGANLLEAMENPKYRDVTPEIMNMRMVKDEKEVKYIQKAVDISEAALRKSARHLHEGMSEKEFSGIFDLEAKKRGGNETKARVRAGINTAKPFARMMEGDITCGPVLVDYGCTYKGYWCDITRMFHVGEPGKAFIHAYEAVLQAREHGLEAAREGEEIARLDNSVRGVLAEHGYGDNLVYTTGHGVGLEVHEHPIVSSRVPKVEVPKLYSDGDVQRLYRVMRAYLVKEEEPRFQQNTVIALEPGVYFDDFGVRVEDMVLIRRKARLLSTLSVRLEDVVITLQ